MKKEFETNQFGVYSAKIRTERGIMKAILFYNAGEKIPHEIHAKFRTNGKTYIYAKGFRGEEDKNGWLLDAQMNLELFEHIRDDWESRCKEFMQKFNQPSRVIADRGALRIIVNGGSVLIPNGIGDGDYNVITGKLSVWEIGKLAKFGFCEIAKFENGSISIESNDCGTGKAIFKIYGSISLQRDQHGNFAAVKIEMDDANNEKK